MIGTVKITQEGTLRHEVVVNGMPVQGIRSIDFHIDPLTIPEVNLELCSGLNFDGLALIGIDFHPESTKECISGLRFALQTDDDLRNGFIASIKSALDDADNYTKNDKLAEQILDRIVGADSCVGI